MDKETIKISTDYTAIAIALFAIFTTNSSSGYDIVDAVVFCLMGG